ncbi:MULTISPECIES: universal stress protein [Corynebacterium]|uniref:Universal stress protein n=2 Tax=Corynebacterium amycolatum TaxID=43765 RepID=A0A1V2C4F6_CORAY|nr:MULTISPECIES: universal stress protein [Corynebacterium]ASE56886.1 universal stress protein [Corynebacterium jeikeium]AIN82587.1 universal stress family protein [Corynebacterium sp. ATCC 6931]AYX82568.1 universal stress protein [Corynebacterium jeikeium]EEB63389.1 universal stress family protein [Corynebacterium amycolatum SK46]KAA0885334.1 universal stress protein [Corynebacterium amycolatum]
MVEPISDSMLIAYDGSDEAKRALAYAGKLLRVKKAYILTAWEPLQRAAARTAGASGMMQPDWDATTEDGDPAHDEAVRICREGVQIAAEAGFVAEPYLVETETTIWSAIVDAAHDLDAGVIISGTRGVTGLRGLFTASTSDALLKNAGRPVLVVPGEKE